MAWLENDVAWTRDDDEHVSSGSGKLLLQETGGWCPEGEPPHWVIFDFGEDMDMDRIELTQPPEASEHPLQCTLEMEFTGGDWAQVKEFTCDPAKATEEISFEFGGGDVASAPRWRLTVVTTEGEGGVNLGQIRFRGRRAVHDDGHDDDGHDDDGHDDDAHDDNDGHDDDGHDDDGHDDDGHEEEEVAHE